ncbi:tetratricopeptide repeat protein 39C-like isoform X2 [Littorina saxatilis]|uniref:Tetratricopeptide repeat protein 39C n=1 Tax=Littorina saxatilis TaxID=31220 RepID=A0AAN9AQR3_9CAEN
MAEGTETGATLNTVDGDDAAFDDVETAMTGINMLLNNGFDEAFVLFDKYKDESPLMHAGYSFVFFMQALMSFEEEKLGEALKVLQETEKRCELGDGFVKSFKRKFSKKKKPANVISTEDRIQRQVIVADSLLYQAILVFTNQDMSSYIKGGWHLRRAWKIYDKIHTEITALKEKMSAHKIQELAASLPEHGNCVDGNHGFQDAVVSSTETVGATPVPAASTNSSSKSQPSAPKSGEVNGSIAPVSDLSEETLARLLGAVKFGYGTFQLCMSMVPPKILKLIEFLGFEGEREVGLACLDYTSRSQDMKAPLATLALLWYHTVLRPFFALDGANNYGGGTHEAEAIIREKQAAFPNSSLFLFFQGRIHRLRRESDKSYELYMKAYEEAKGQREIELMCLYEISWFNLIKLNWPTAMEGFQRLRKESKWSKCYYSYLIAVCYGSQGMIKDSHVMFQEVPGLLKRKNNQIEAFAARRAEKFKKEEPTQEHCRLLALELIFLWHALPMCNADDLKPFLNVCEMQTDHKQLHLKCLLEGAVYKELGEEDMAVQCLKEAIARHQGRKDDNHVAAFTLFELASIYMKSPQTKQLAKEHLQQIKDSYKDYDFENRLSVRVNNALKQLKRDS